MNKPLLSLALVASLGATALMASASTTIPAGTEIDTTIQQTVDSGKAQNGDKFTLVEKDTLFHHNAALKGAVIDGHVENVSAAHPGHSASMTIVLDDITVNGQTQPINARLKSLKEFEPHKHIFRDSAVIVGSAVAGHVVASKTGHAHGGLAGAAAGVGLVAAMKSNIVVKHGTEVKLKLNSALDI